MPIDNPYAMYINCDGSMDYDSRNSGGIGFNISFPESIGLDPIPISRGIYTGANIEMLEIEALIEAMEHAIEVWKTFRVELSIVNRIILVTDRFGLKDEDKTSAFRIREWRRNKWKNFEGKPIKNHKQLDRLDKTRAKLSQVSRCPVEIVYRRRKQNRVADKLAKKGKAEGIPIDRLEKKGEKIGRRKFEGAEIKYVRIKREMTLHINVFRKDPVQNEWEVWVEICSGEDIGSKLKIYVDNIIASELKRGNEYIIKVSDVFRSHIRIHSELNHVDKSNTTGEAPHEG